MRWLRDLRRGMAIGFAQAFARRVQSQLPDPPDVSNGNPLAGSRHPGVSDPLNLLEANYAEAGDGFVASLAAILELARRRDDEELLGHLRWVRAALEQWSSTSLALETARRQP